MATGFSNLAANAQAPEPPSNTQTVVFCKSEGPLLRDEAGNLAWLTTNELVAQASHCVAPEIPGLYRAARIQGDVLIDILVDRAGKVACARLVSGHPILAGTAIEAASRWTFKRRKQAGKRVSFYGHLAFHFSYNATTKNENPCLETHW